MKKITVISILVLAFSFSAHAVKTAAKARGAGGNCPSGWLEVGPPNYTIGCEPNLVKGEVHDSVIDARPKRKLKNLKNPDGSYSGLSVGN